MATGGGHVPPLVLNRLGGDDEAASKVWASIEERAGKLKNEQERGKRKPAVEVGRNSPSMTKYCLLSFSWVFLGLELICPASSELVCLWRSVKHFLGMANPNFGWSWLFPTPSISSFVPRMSFPIDPVPVIVCQFVSFQICNPSFSFVSPPHSTGTAVIRFF